MSARQHKSTHTPKRHLGASISSPGDINISSASRAALNGSSSSCSSSPGDGPQRIRNSASTRLTKPKVAEKPSVKDNTLETLFVRQHPTHRPVTILNNISLCFDGNNNMDSTTMRGLENVKVVSKVSVLEDGEVTESENEGSCLRSLTSSLGRLESGEATESESLHVVPSRLDILEGSEVTELESDETTCYRVVISRRGSLEGGGFTKLQSEDTPCRPATTTTFKHANKDVIKSDNECAACLTRMVRSKNSDVTTSDDDAQSARSSVQQLAELPQEIVVASSGRRRSGRRGDPALHAATRLDKKLRYLERETRRMHHDLERLSQRYMTTDARAADNLRDVRLLDEMVVTLERQLERMTVRRWLKGSGLSRDTLVVQ